MLTLALAGVHYHVGIVGVNLLFHLARYFFCLWTYRFVHLSTNVAIYNTICNAVFNALCVGWFVMAVQSCLVNHTIVTDPTIWEPGFSLPPHTWSLMNRFRTGQGPCHANLHKWGLAQSPSCDCGQRQTMNPIVDTCPLTEFEGRLNLLHEVVDDTVIWLQSTATAALAK